MNAPARPLREQSPYQGYAYAYPHKTAYRPLEPALPLSELWREEDRSSLFWYLHVPFCEMRCGFCNLFTAVGLDDLHERYLDTVQRQAEVVAEALGDRTFAVGAVGGGTPTLLEPALLSRALDILEGALGAELQSGPWSVETSPATALPERLAVLVERGVSRISMGVQSFIEAEVHGAGRPQDNAEVERALDAIAASGVATRNVDLIYGLPHQTDDSWRYSLDRALQWAPEEIFLYPLYVRPLTGLDRTGRSWDDHRLALYRIGRDHLCQRGYEQVSMRLFRRTDAPAHRTDYRCQRDGMVGLGAGARSYTSTVHYATEWGVGRKRVKGILAQYLDRTDAEHGVADTGIVLEGDEQRRRHVLQSLLHAEGLRTDFYRERFDTDPLHDLPQLHELVEQGLADHRPWGLQLTPAGVERSDAIGPWLTSPAMWARMRDFDLR